VPLCVIVTHLVHEEQVGPKVNMFTLHCFVLA